MEHLETACLYGADAVYLGVQGESSLRAGAKNFSLVDLGAAVAYAHARGVRVYLALNTYPHDRQMEELPEIILYARDIGVDAVIVSDIGVLSLVREIAPGLPLHLSTQANAVNLRAIQAWASLGISRIILARELSFNEIEYIRKNTGVELEMFVHGSICVSISGRCLISNYLNSRDANQGRCTQPCRWDYALFERTRPGQYMPVVEEDGYTFLYNSKDLCLLPVMDKVMALGIEGLKIEGRNRTSLYIATTIQTYRKARDAFLDDPEVFLIRQDWLEEIEKISNRSYFTGFFLGEPDGRGINYDFKGYIQPYQMAARVIGHNGDKTILEARNPLIEGMKIELLPVRDAGRMKQTFTLSGMQVKGAGKERIRPNEVFEMKLPFETVAGELMRKPFSEGDKVVLRCGNAG